MQTINGKLITENPDNAVVLQHKLEQIVSKSEQLDLGLQTQIQQIEALKMSLIVLEKNLNNRDLERLKQIKLSHDSLRQQISQKLFKISVATVLGFLSIWGLLLVNNQLEKNQKSAHTALINISEIRVS